MAVENHFSAKTAYWSDVDETACAVMGARFPDAEPIGDLTTLDLTMLHADIITAGYPCQPFSLAGARKGTNDERHLWPYIRNTVSVLRPRFVVLENVAGHLSLGAATVVGDLAALGYDAQWAVIRASDVGAVHQRKRWFCVATNTDYVSAGGISTTPPGAETQRGNAGQLNNGFEDATRGRGFWRHYWPAIDGWERIVGRPAPDPITDGKLSAAFVEWMMGLESGHVTDIASSRPKALACLGNGVVPQQAALALELLT